jgi:hypothetical protein
VSIGVVRAQSLAGVRAADSSCRVHAMPAALMAGHHIAMPALW